MTEKSQCELCGHPATVHLTQIINGQVHKVDLCEECAREKGMNTPAGLSLAEFFGSKAEAEANALACPECGRTAAGLQKTGRMGCPACYEAFREELPGLLEQLHKGAAHKGKTPRGWRADAASLRSRVRDLERELRLAVEEERYEEAARFRDEIHQLHVQSASLS